jgi:hypothetical protein
MSMRFDLKSRPAFRTLAVAAMLFCLPALAAAQPGPDKNDDKAGVGERYWVEFTATWWQPDLTGFVGSDRLGLAGTSIDFLTDLGFDSVRQNDIRFVLRPAKKHKLRVQYTPASFTGQNVLTREVTFAGLVYPISLPIESRLSWNVLRVGYEWDFFYRPRGFVGLIVETGITELEAGLDSFLASGEVTGSAPLVAFGLAGRVYPVKHLAIHLEGTGLKLTDLEPNHFFQTMSLDMSATYNITRNFGVSGGWRRSNTELRIDEDRGKLDFSGIWFGGVVRY